MVFVSATLQCNIYLRLWDVGAERPSTRDGTSQKPGRNDRVWGGRGADLLWGGRIDRKLQSLVEHVSGWSASWVSAHVGRVPWEHHKFLPARRYASAGKSDRNMSVRPSDVCLSVTRRYCVMISSPSGSPKTLVF